MPQLQQQKKFVAPTKPVAPKFDPSKVDFSHASLFDLALLARIEALEKTLALFPKETQSVSVDQEKRDSIAKVAVAQVADCTTMEESHVASEQ